MHRICGLAGRLQVSGPGRGSDIGRVLSRGGKKTKTKKTTPWGGVGGNRKASPFGPGRPGVRFGARDLDLKPWFLSANGEPPARFAQTTWRSDAYGGLLLFFGFGQALSGFLG